MITLSRRAFALAVGGTALGLLSAPGLASGPRMRVIIDNDFGGDPDGLFQLAFFALSPSVAVPLVVGSHYRDFGDADLVPDKAAASVTKASELLSILAPRATPPLVAGSPARLGEGSASAATEAIVRAAMTGDPALPLFYAAGGSLTEIARAWLAEPAIGARLKLVWIGGNEHADLAAPPPGPAEPEYNYNLDREAAEIVFNRSDIEIWQVPRNAFRTLLVGLGELEELGRSGPLGNYLWRQVEAAHARLSLNLPSFVFSAGESLMLGDTALVTLTALQSAFQPDTASSDYVLRPCPTLLADGSYAANPGGRMMRVYNRIDSRLTFAEMMAKIRAADRALQAADRALLSAG